MSTDLPPEAFTKETLQAAFNWLQDQPEPVKATIHTPERLVSLYQKSQRLNDVDAPVSSKKFVDELKTLASSLDQFNSSPIEATATNPINEEKQPQEDWNQLFSSPAPAVPTARPKNQEKVTSSSFSLDALTSQRVAQVKERFNLSSDTEALRLLVSLGFEKFSKFQ